jgi:hypothetical protein
MAAQNGSGPAVVPDALGTGGRAILAARQLYQLQTQAAELEVLVLVEELAEDDIVPGMLGKGGTTVTVAARRTQIERAIERLLAANDHEHFGAAVQLVRKQMVPDLQPCEGR